MSFVHLHLHTHYSFLEWLWKPDKFISKAKELWMPWIAMTDSWGLYGAFEFYKSCKSHWINPIIWLTAYISEKWRADKSKDNNIYDIILLAKNEKWYNNLIQLVTFSQLEWYYFKPRIDFELLKEFWNNIIALSWGLKGEIPQHFATGRSEDFIKERIDYYEWIFWKWNFYLELQEHPDQWWLVDISHKIYDFAKKYWYPVVAGHDVHYVEEKEKDAQDILYCIGDWRSLEDPDRPTFIEWNYALRPADEMNELFAYAPEAISNTLKINSEINLTIRYWQELIPHCDIWEDNEAIFKKFKKICAENIWKNGLKDLDEEEWFLRYMCFSWLKRRYNSFNLSEEEIFELVKKTWIKWTDKELPELSPEELREICLRFYTSKKLEILKEMTEEQNNIIDRLEYELLVVDMMGYNAYFLICADFINWAKDNWIPVWPWRWSAAWALLAYLSWITNIDPLKFDLLFERFLNPSRVSMPDIDVDFSDKWRWRVLEYVRNKYWSEYVAQICTFWTMAARASVKDVGKVMGLSFSEMNDLSKLMLDKPWSSITKSLEESLEFKEAYDTNPEYKKVIDTALQLEWSIRQLWVHACAVIIAPEKMTNFCPLQNPPKDNTSIVTQFSAYPLEDIWLLKMDFLWLKNLTIIDNCLKIIKWSKWIDLDIDVIDTQDQKVLDIFCEWDTTWVFQFESSWMRKYLKELKPTRFEDIIVMVSLYRPGPLQYIPTYIARSHGLETVEYAHESIKKILEPTYWIAVYQEQIMQMVQAFAGFSLWDADVLRRAIWKKNVELLMDQKKKFYSEALKLWHPEELSRTIFEDVIEPFAWYWFNKSHAACYAFIAYQTAYLKAYYPTEFMTALMISDEEDTERMSMQVLECRERWINILSPDINESLKHFTYIDDKNIRFWLMAIKWLWDVPVKKIINTKKDSWKFKDIVDLIDRWWSDLINKKSLSSLTYSWALDLFWDRADLIESIPKIIEYLKENQKKAQTAQIWLFDMLWDMWNSWSDKDKDISDNENSNLKFCLKKAKEPLSFEQKIRWEKQVIGYFVSWSPFVWIETFISKHSIWESEILKEIKHFEEADELIIDSHSNPIQKIEKNKDNAVGGPLVGAQPSDPAPKPKQKRIKVKVFWYVNSIRKVQTKTWWSMLIVQCEWTKFNFTVLVFPKNYDSMKNSIEEDMILRIDWFFQFNKDSWEIAIIPDSIRKYSITRVRDIAKSQWAKIWAKSENDVHEEIIENKFWKKDEQIIKMSDTLSYEETQEYLFELRTNLKNSKIWNIKVSVKTGDNVLYTWFSVRNNI